MLHIWTERASKMHHSVLFTIRWEFKLLNWDRYMLVLMCTVVGAHRVLACKSAVDGGCV